MLIYSLEPGEVFVFGSNLAGRHGKGAAYTARRQFGAKQGQGVGPQGQCYAIPTKTIHLDTLPLPAIRSYVADFLAYATAHPEKKFLVTPIGTGLAGYKAEQIAPMFANVPRNVIRPAEFTAHLGGVHDERNQIADNAAQPAIPVGPDENRSGSTGES